MADYKSSHTGQEIDSAVSAVANKVDKIDGKGLSTNDYTNADKNKLDSIDMSSKQDVINDLTEIRSGAQKGETAIQPNDNISSLTNDSGFITSSYHDESKQDTLVSGTNIKTINGNSILGEGNLVIQGGQGGLTSVAHDNTMTGAGTNENPLGVDSSKYATSAQGAKADTAVQPTDLSTVATSGSYNDLSDTPTIPTVPTNISSFTNDSGYVTNSYHDNTKQDALVSGTNIKTINNQSILGEGNITISGGGSVSIPTQCLYGVPNYFEGKKILVTGDSITDTVGNYAQGYPWWKNLQDWLGLAQVYNDGKSSTGIKRGAPGLFNRIDTWNTTYGTDFDAIIIMENMNDMYKDVSLSSFTLGQWGDNTIDTQYGAVKLVIEKLQALYPMTPILWVTSGPRKHYGRLEINPINPGHGRDSEFEPMVEAIKEVCGHYGVPVCDMYHNSLLRPWIASTNSAWFQSADGVHPNKVGHQIMAQTILQSFVANIPSVAGTHGLYTKRDISYNLTDVKVINNMAYITNGSEFFCWLKPTSDDSTIDSVTVTMGGTNITSSAWKPSTNTIEIGSVTGNVNITATSSSSATRYNITNNLTNISTTNNNTAITEGSTYSATLNPLEGYSVGSVVVKMNNIDITSTAYNTTTHTITIPNVNADISIVAVGEIRVLNIVNDLVGLTNSNTATTINFGEEYTGTLIKDEEEAIIENVTVLMDETDYTNSNYDALTNTIHFDRVVGNITITAVAGEGYTITNNLSGASTSNPRTGINKNSEYTAVITPDAGRAIGNVSVVMGGTNITSSVYNEGTHTISINAVTANLVITVTTIAQVYTITNALTGVANSNIATSKSYGESYIATLTAETEGYAVIVDSITMGGNNVTYSVYNESTNTVNIVAVNGDIVIIAHESNAMPKEFTSADFIRGAIENDGTLKPNVDGGLNNIYSIEIIHISETIPGNITLHANSQGKQGIAKIAYYDEQGNWLNNTKWYNYNGDLDTSIDIPAGSHIRIAMASAVKYGTTDIDITLSGATITIYEKSLPTKNLVSLSCAGNLVKTAYVAGESLDITGLVVTASYDDSSTEVLAAEDLVYNPAILTAGVTSVELSYTYKDITRTCTVNGITVEDSPLPTIVWEQGAIDGFGANVDNATRIRVYADDTLDMNKYDVTIQTFNGAKAAWWGMSMIPDGEAHSTNPLGNWTDFSTPTTVTKAIPYNYIRIACKKLDESNIVPSEADNYITVTLTKK